MTGTVKTISGEPVIGASVIVLETNRGNVTGLEGDFSVEATPGQTLSVSFLGYNTQQIKVGSQTSFDITLTEDSKQISEVLVVGYTPMRKSDFTGSIASVKASELSATTPTVGQSLVGKVAGVEVHQTSGAPGDGVTIRVRGVNSLSASSAPLYVIDGYPASEDVFINPNDIESIDILKDAASAAIYGSRGASGVVLITTKRGKDGEAAKVSYDFSYGIQQLDHKVDLLNSTQFRDLLIDARNNSYRLRATAAGVSWSPYDDNTIRAAKGFSLAEVGIHPMFYDFTTRTPVTPQYDTDWQDELFSNAGIMRHNVSVIGGTKAIKYMASVGYMDQDGIIAPSNHNRINARINLDAQITKRLTASISYSMYDAKNTVVQAEGRMINDGVIQSALMYLPNLPAYEENGDYARSAMIRMKTDWGMNFPENPLAIANELDINEKMSRHNLNLNLVYEFLPDLKLSARLGQQWYNYRYFYYRPMSIGRDAAPAYSEELRSSNIARTTSTYDVDRLGEFTLSYKKKIGRHHIDALAGYTLQKKTYDRLGVEATGFADDRIHEVTGHGSNASDISLYSTRKAAWAMMSFLTRVNYSFDDRYTLTGSFRADGSSKLAPGHRWGYFPSFSAAWRISGEKFLRDVSWINDLKLRAGWGQTGNQAGLAEYGWMQQYSTNYYDWTLTENAQAVPTVGGRSNIKNEDLTWETSSQTNVGLDFALLNNRLSLSLDYYYKYTKDMLMSVPLPSPYPNITRNDGEMSNQGFEITLSSVNIARKDFNWSTDLNVSLNRNKVEKLNLKQVYYYATTSDATNDNVVRMTPGHPLSMFWGYVSKGVDPETGDLVYEDRNGDGEITPLDKTWIGNANPKFTFGMTNNFSWKGLNLNILITGSYGNDIFNASRIETEGMASANNQTTTVLRRWRIPGQQTDVFRSDNPAWNVKNSSYWVEDGSYLKVKNITLSYDITSPKLKRINITRIQPYISLQNFITWTGYSGYDPEVSQSESATQMGIDWGTYPNVRTVVVGLNLTF